MVAMVSDAQPRILAQARSAFHRSIDPREGWFGEARKSEAPSAIEAPA
jgi:hypothetical protein